MDNLGRAFNFMFEDPEWLQKILIGGCFVLLSCILIGVPFVFGYMLLLIKNTTEGRPVPLPAWDNLGDKFTSGLMFLVMLLLWAVPVWLVSIVLIMIPCIGWIILVPFVLAVYLLIPYIMARFAVGGKISDAFDFAGIIAFLTQNLMNLVIVLVMSIVLNIISYFGILALGVGFLFTNFWAQLGIAYLAGELYRTGQKGKAVTAQP
ncbi:MAG: DUF4013 domain-containing protein [bacterium]|nr:DUF4013 domain-containing protein [bacterium]